MKKTQKGFTLVELLVVIAILAILSTVAVVGYTSFINKAEKQATETEIAQIKSVVEAATITDKAYIVIDGDYVIFSKDDNGVITVTTGDEDDVGDKDIDLTNELPKELLEKLDCTGSALKYQYDDDASVITIYPEATEEDEEDEEENA